MNLPQLIEELKRRNVFKVATAYAIAGWLIIQVIATIAPQLGFPVWVPPFFTILVLVGFPLALIFAWAFELTPDGIKKSVEVEQQVSIRSQTGKKLNGLTTAILIATVVFLLVERVFFAPHAIQEEIAELPTSEVASIAVLPFADMSAEGDQEYFSDGLSEELLNALAKLKKIKVAGRTSSFKFKGEITDIALVGEQLGVNHILGGSVRKAGGRVRITAQLVQARDGFHMWSQSYDRELTTTNIFDIQEEIARQVLQELKVRLLPEEQAQLQAAPTQDIEAYQTYLKANQLVVDRNIDEMEAAIELYKEALRMDPGFASARARLAIAYNHKSDYGNIPYEEIQVLMKRQIDLALGMDPNLAEGYAALGLYEQYQGNLEVAIEALERSVALNPNLTDVYNWLGNIYNSERLDEPRKQILVYKTAYEIDPLNPFTILNRAWASGIEGNYEEAEYYYQKNLRINPNFLNTYYNHTMFKASPPFGRLDIALQYVDMALAINPTFTLSLLGGTLISTALEDDPLARFYYQELQQHFSESRYYKNVVALYNGFIRDFTGYERDVLEFYEQSGVQPLIAADFIGLYGYGLATGNIGRVVPFYQEFDPDLFEATLSMPSKASIDKAFQLAVLLSRSGDTAQAQVLTRAVCRFAGDSPQWLIGGAEDVEYLKYQSYCALLEGNYTQLEQRLRQRFEDQGDILYVSQELLVLERYIPQAYTSAIQGLHEQVRAELGRQRENVRTYLKTNNRWNPAWDAAE